MNTPDFETRLRSLTPAATDLSAIAAAYAAGRRDGRRRASGAMWLHRAAVAASLCVAAGAAWVAATNRVPPTKTVAIAQTAPAPPPRELPAPVVRREPSPPPEQWRPTVLALRSAVLAGGRIDLAALAPERPDATTTTRAAAARPVTAPPRPPTAGELMRQFARNDL